MRSIYYLAVVIFTAVSCGRLPVTGITAPAAEVLFSVDYESEDMNTMRVSVSVPGLSASNNIFQFAATAPGTYQVMDIGRFVSDFKAFDEGGKEVATTKVSTNQYKLHQPARVRSIVYTVKETWDTPVEENRIYKMCGTSIEEDHFLFNSHCVLGYFKGLQALPIRLRIAPREGWQVGTVLERDPAGFFLADNFDHMVDSPILMGKLTSAAMDVNGTEVDIYAYSMTGMIHASQILESMSDLLKAADKFLEGLPVDRYTFLFHFEHSSHGAWEHSYSSEYIYKEMEWELLAENVLATASHEFFHIVMPLNIHSEVIAQFNFIEPEPSRHLWLYEGVTEWASDMILLHGGLIDMAEFLDRQQEKLIIDQAMYDPSYSLVDLALTSYTREGQTQYANIYNAGALAAALLDILIIEKTDGQYSLRELIIDLAKDYGPDRPFNEKNFFDEVAERTHPSVRAFIKDHIEGTADLPLHEYYSALGISYNEVVIDSQSSSLGFYSIPMSTGLYMLSDPFSPGSTPLQKLDYITSIDGQPVHAGNIEAFLAEFAQKPVGTPFTVEFSRAGQLLETECRTVVKHDFHVLEPMADPSLEQLGLRDKWLGRTEAGE